MLASMLLLPADILGDQMTGITLFLPDNAAVNSTLNKKGLDLPGLLKVQSLCEQIIAYHILPSPLEVRARLWALGSAFSSLHLLSHTTGCQQHVLVMLSHQSMGWDMAQQGWHAGDAAGSFKGLSMPHADPSAGLKGQPLLPTPCG